MMANTNFFAKRTLLLAFLLLIGACGSKGEDELLVSAERYLQKNELKAATIELKNLLQSNPSSAPARFLLGKTLFDAGDMPGAEIELRRALELGHPQSAVAPVLARVLLARQELKKLIEQYGDLALDDKAAMAAVQAQVALAYAAQDQHAKAREVIVNALRLAPQSPSVLLANARIKAAVSDFDSSLAALDEMLARTPSDFEALQFRGYVLLHGKKDQKGAIAAYKQALVVKPDDPSAHSILISLYLVQRDGNAASNQFEALRTALPDHQLTKFYDAQITFARGEFVRARELALDLVRLAPSNAAFLQLAGAIELKLGELSQAETYLTQAVQLAAQFGGARTLLAQLYLRTDRPAKATSILRPMLDRPGADSEILMLAGHANLLVDDTKAADVYFKRAAALKPGDSAPRSALALSQLSKGNTEAAFSELQSIAASEQGIEADLALIGGHMRRREYDLAMRSIADMEKKQPQNPIAADLRGRVYLLRGDLAGARKSFEQAVALKPGYVSSVIKLGAIDLIEKKPEAAETRVRELLKVDPKNVQGWLALADLKRRGGGTPGEVAKLMGEAITANPTDPEPRLAQIDFHLGRGDIPAGLAAAQAGVAAIPMSAELMDRQARALMVSGDLNRASSTFAKIAAEHADSALGYLGLAEINVANRDYAAAAKNSKRALELAPTSESAQQLSVIAAIQQKRPKEALAVAQMMQIQRPNDAIGWIFEGDIEIGENNWDRAQNALRQAISKPNPAQAPMRLHFALLGGKKAPEADKFAASWIAAHPQDMAFLTYLAGVATNRNDTVLAEKYYQQILKFQPENAFALNNLAWVFIKQKRPGAVALAERALKSAPAPVEIMDTLASALSSENQHAKAIEMQKKVISQAPNTPAYHLTMAKIYLQARDPALAKAELEGLAKVKENFPGRDEVAPLLKSLP